jgi:drug/metabolite transporter (DMT)-like permease
MTSSSHLRGILAMLTAMGVLIGSDTCMKLALPDAPFFQLVVMRGIGGVLVCLLLLLVLGQGRDISRAVNPMLLARGACEVVANFAFTLALFNMAIADLTAIAQTCPLFVLLGAWLIWGERLQTPQLLLIGLGMCGALLVAQPGTSAASPYAVLGFFTAIAAAVRDLITRKVPGEIPALVVALTVLAMLTLAGVAGMLLFETPVVPQPRTMGLMLFAGALMVGGHACVYLAYRIAPARTVAPFMYSLTLWAVLAGLLLFNDVPNPLAIAGMALVALAGLLIIFLDQRRVVLG